MIRYATRIGAYEYPYRTSLDDTIENTDLVVEGIFGRASFGSRPNSRRIVVKGEMRLDGYDGPFVGDRQALLQHLVEEFLYAHRPLDPGMEGGQTHHTFYMNDDPDQAENIRTIDVTVKSITMGEYKKPLSVVPFSVEMESGGDPFKVGGYTLTIALDTDGSPTLVANPGTAWTRPVYTLTVDWDSAGTIALVNDTSGETLTLSPSASGVYVIDCERAYMENSGVVTRGGVDVIEEMDDDFPILRGGANSVRIVAAGGVEVTAASCTLVPRWN
jgi:hypothetical protein